MVDYIKRDKNDFFNYSITSFIFKNKIFLLTLRLLTLFIFIFAIFYGFFNQIPQKYHFTVAIFWSFFWPFFMVVSLGTFGSVFCAICPHGFLGKYITKYGLKLKLPQTFHNPLIGLCVLIVAYWVFLYIFPQTLKSPFAGSMFFLILTIFAFSSFFLFKDMSYCKYLCPIGSVTSSFSKTSFTWLATYQEACASCHGYECAKACPYHLSPFNFDKKSSMQECKLCMECAYACEAVGFFAKKPSNSLFDINKSAKSSEVWTYILIASVASIAMSLQNALGHSPISQSLPWKIASIKAKEMFGETFFSVEGLVVFVLAFGLSIFFSVGSYKLVSKMFNLEYKKVFLTAGYAIAPVVIFGGMAQTLPFFFTHYGSDTLNSIFTLFVSDFKPFGAFIEKTSPVLKIFGLLHFVGAFLGLWILRKRLRFLNIESKNINKVFFILGSFHFFYISMISFIVFVFIKFS